MYFNTFKYAISYLFILFFLLLQQDDEDKGGKWTGYSGAKRVNRVVIVGQKK